MSDALKNTVETPRSEEMEENEITVHVDGADVGVPARSPLMEAAASTCESEEWVDIPLYDEVPFEDENEIRSVETDSDDHPPIVFHPDSESDYQATPSESFGEMLYDLSMFLVRIILNIGVLIIGWFGAIRNLFRY